MPPLPVGGEGQLQQGAVAVGLQAQGAAGGVLDALHQGHHRVLAAGHGGAVDRHDAIAGLQAGAVGRLAGLHGGHHHTGGGAEARGDAEHQALGQQHAPGQQQVGDHAGGDHQGPLGQGPVAHQVGIVGGDAAVVLVVGEGHEAAQGDGPQGEQDAAALPLDQGGPEADREATDPDALPGGCEEVAGLVHHDQARQDRQRRQYTHSVARLRWPHSAGTAAPPGRWRGRRGGIA